VGGVNLANKITISRIILTPIFITAIVYSRMDIALALFTLAIISDGLDGFIARTLNQKTALGTVLDPIADKILLVSAFICLSLVNTVPAHLKLPAYVPIIVISRDAIIVLGSVIVYFIKGDVKIHPSFWGKFTTFFQMMTIVSILVKFAHAEVVWDIAVLLTIISGADYVIKGSKALSEVNLNHKGKH